MKRNAEEATAAIQKLTTSPVQASCLTSLTDAQLTAARSIERSKFDRRAMRRARNSFADAIAILKGSSR